MKQDHDSKFAKSFSDVLRLWLRANRNRVILIAVLFVLALSFFAGEKLFSPSGEKNGNETAEESGNTDPSRIIGEASSEDKTREPETSLPEGSSESGSTKEAESISESGTEKGNEKENEPETGGTEPEETSPVESVTPNPSITVTPVSPSTVTPIPQITVTPVPPEESFLQPTVSPVPTPEPESSGEAQTPEIETEEPTSREVQTEAEEGYILCTISVSCEHVFDNEDLVPDEKWMVIPDDGLILPPTQMKVKEGSTVYQVLRAACEQNGILLDAALFSAYVRGIGNLYEFDLGRQSGWMYEVNGYYPPVGCGSYRVSEGDVIVWNYTCNRGDLQPEGEKDNGSNLK